MQIEINGESTTIDGPVSVAELVVQHTGRERPLGVAVAIGGVVVPRSQWEERLVQAGDAIELVGVMQGG